MAGVYYSAKVKCQRCGRENVIDAGAEKEDDWEEKLYPERCECGGVWKVLERR